MTYMGYQGYIGEKCYLLHKHFLQEFCVNALLISEVGIIGLEWTHRVFHFHVTPYISSISQFLVTIYLWWQSSNQTSGIISEISCMVESGERLGLCITKMDQKRSEEQLWKKTACVLLW